MGNAAPGSVWKRICDKVYGNREIRVLMCGLDAAGKTTALYKLKLGEVVTTIPTIGFNVETVSYKNVNFTAWDVGGRDKIVSDLEYIFFVHTHGIHNTGFNVETITYKGINFTTWDVSGRSGIRPLWRHYYQNTDVLIFVVDSNDRERISECKDELWRFLQEDELKDCVLLVMANKQDLPNAMSTAEVTERMELNALRNRTWYIQSTCATTGDGLYDGLSWLKEQLNSKQVTKTVTKPLQETKNSVGKSGLLSSWYTTLSSYFSSPIPVEG